ncbi:hypothetical protein [Sphingomonas echinoides]|uniref:hypothetical protein n=1 Tax=Sphingomonas echinoides TaxID=59803 RepID=UPI0024131041|nr:hypothetical protein [Sphingomonas echinoides]
MTADEREALGTLLRRFDQAGSMATILACDTSNSADMSDALAGLGETLNELCARMDGILSPVI